MKILLLTIFITSTTADYVCDGLFLNQEYYKTKIIKDGINRIHELTFNRNDNTAYFTFEQIAKVPTRMLGYVKLDDESSGVIEGVRNATGLALDQNLNRLYIGGSDGLFMMNMNNKEKVPEKLPVNDDIRSLFVKNNVVYFVNSKKEGHRFEFGVVNPVFELQGYAIEKFILDDDNNIMFLQNNKPYRIKLGTKLVNSHEKIFVTDIATDLNFKPYVCAKDGLYVYNKYKYVLDKVGDLKDIRKLAFVSANEPIYVVVDTLIRLIKQSVPCYGD